MTVSTKEQILSYLAEKSKQFSKQNRILQTAGSISDALFISRNLASQYLNEMVKENKLIKINSRPVGFLHRASVEKNYGCRLTEDTYQNLDEFLMTLNYTCQKERDFVKAVGHAGSLGYCIDQCRAAVGYPDFGIPILLYGEAGTGKHFLLDLMVEYAVNLEIIERGKKAVCIDCNDYQKKPSVFWEKLMGAESGDGYGKGWLAEAQDSLMMIENIDCLMASIQEVLPLLIEKAREKRVRLAFTSTVAPDQFMLSVLLRYIPIIVRIPALEERSQEEREELIISFFQKESLNFKKEIKISQRVLQAFSENRFKGNIREMKNDISICCANALMQRADAEEIHVFLYHLPEGMITSLPVEGSSGEEQSMIPISRYKRGENMDQYLNLLKNMVLLKAEYEENHNWNRYMNQMYAQVKAYYNFLVFQRGSTNVRSEAIRLVLESVIDYIEKKYNITLSVNWGLIIAKLICQQIQDSFQIMQWEKQYGQELLVIYKGIRERFTKAAVVADDFTDTLKENLDLEVSLAVRILLMLEINQYSKKIVINENAGLIICHGYSTASSIADSVNSILNEKVFEAIDMPFDSQVEQVVLALQQRLRKMTGIKNVFLLIDTGSLAEIDAYMGEVPGITLGILTNVSTAMALSIGTAMMTGEEMEVVMREVAEEMKPTYRIIKNREKEPLIIFISESGIQAAERMKKLFDGSLTRMFPIQTLAFDYYRLVKNGRSDEIFEKYNVLCVIGSFDSGMDGLPYIGLEDIISRKSMGILEDVFLDYMDENEIEKFKANFLKRFSLENVVQYLTILNADVLLNMVEEAREMMQNRMNCRFSGRTLSGLYIHICCLTERLVTKAEIQTYGDPDFAKEQAGFIQIMSESFDAICSHYGIVLPVSEIAYVFDYIKNDIRIKQNKKRKEQG